MTSGDRTIIFMLSLLGLSSKQPVPRKSNPVQQKPKEDIISPIEPLLLQQKKLNDLLICFFSYIFLYLDDQLIFSFTVIFCTKL